MAGVVFSIEPTLKSKPKPVDVPSITRDAMEILAVIGLVGNIVQFVDFGSKLISKLVQLFQYSEVVLTENINTETATNHLILLNNKLENAASTTGDKALEKLCKSCSSIAVELLGALDKLKEHGGKKRNGKA